MRRMICTTLAWLVAALSFATVASAAPLPPIADFWRPPQYASPQVSPNGQYFAVLTPVKGRMNIAVIDLAGRKAKLLTGFDDYDVIELHWVGNERLVYSLGLYNSPTGAGQFDGGGFFMVARDGSESRQLSPTVRQLRSSNSAVYRGLQYVDEVPGSNEEVYAQARERSIESLDVYRVNVRNGRKTLMTETRPGRVGDWTLDRHQLPRVAMSSVKDTRVQVVYYRADERDAWHELWRFDPAKGPATYPLYFDDDNQTLLVASNEGRDTMAVFRYDPRTKTRGELIAEHPRFDIGVDEEGEPTGQLRIDRKTRRVVGITVEGAKRETVWMDADYERIQRTLDAALPGTINDFERTPDGRRLLVSTYSDQKPVRWFLFDEDKRTLEELFASRPWLGPEQLVEMKPVFYRTRDGLEILAYVMLPRDRKAGEKLPTVIHIHGGPALRADFWGFDSFGAREGQLLASRGYAVVVPNFRITPGFGAKIFYSGFRQMGRKMQEDIEDVTDWAVNEGFADPDRICLSGASYGGYATLMGLAKTPDKYKCGIAGLAVTDLRMIMTSPVGDIANSEEAVSFWKAMAGDPDQDAAEMDAVSPAYLADRIKAPVLMYSGADDIRVPLEQTQKMRNALEARGRKVRWIVKNEEGHGYGRLENNVDLYTQVLEFLDQTIGARGAEPPKKQP